jgi:hypothetical protein
LTGLVVAGVTDFIALDVETANADFGSICAIGLVHFRAGEVFKSLSLALDLRLRLARPSGLARRPHEQIQLKRGDGAVKGSQDVTEPIAGCVL